jgi:hypothetical protein
MAAKKYPTPNLDNVTDGGLVDILANERAKEKEAKFYAGFYGDALKGRLRAQKRLVNEAEVHGENYCGVVSISEPERFDTKGLRAAAEAGDKAAADILKRFLKVGDPVVTLNIKELVKPPAPAPAPGKKGK